MTKADIVELTGTKDAEQQIAWLKQHRIPFLIGLDAQPKVLIDSIFSIMGVVNPQNKTKKTEPNWSAM